MSVFEQLRVSSLSAIKDNLLVAMPEAKTRPLTSLPSSKEADPGDT